MSLHALRRWAPTGFLAIAICAGTSGAQSASSSPIRLLSGERESRLRAEQLLVPSAGDGVLLRSLSRKLGASVDSAVPRLPLLPEIEFVRNSALPSSANDGALHAARGANLRLTGGMAWRSGRVRVVVAPQLFYEENLRFQVIQYPQDPGALRSVWANPFHPLPQSIDLPLRFGEQRHLALDPGQSSVTVDLGAIEVGAATENLWWGPGIRNALVLSNNAAGFPHLLVRSPRPLTTRVGTIDFDVVAGRLSESEYFDADPSNDVRSIAGGAVTWQQPGNAGLQLGVARLGIFGSGGHDFMSSVFGRWVFAPSGFEAYVEWARFEDPRSLRDFLEFPTHSQGYTYGLQWATRAAKGRILQLQTEVTYLEPSASLRLRPELASYTSRRVPQGFTQGGEVLGAAIGPASSSQWLALDLLGGRWRAGVFASRTRYDESGLFRPEIPALKDHDVSVTGGMRGSLDMKLVSLSVELANTARLNYLYQAGYVADPSTGGFQGIDLTNRTLSVILSTASQH